jgi:putative endonuclease
MVSLALARARLLEMVVYALARADKEKKSPQSEAELAAYFHLKRLGSRVVGRNWRSGHYPGDIDLIAWKGETLCFVDVGIRRQSASAKPATRRPADDYTGEALRRLAKDYIRKAPYEGVEVRYDLIIVDLKQDLQPEGQGRATSGRPRPECEYIRGAF